MNAEAYGKARVHAHAPFWQPTVETNDSKQRFPITTHNARNQSTTGCHGPLIGWVTVQLFYSGTRATPQKITTRHAQRGLRNKAGWSNWTMIQPDPTGCLMTLQKQAFGLIMCAVQARPTSTAQQPAANQLRMHGVLPLCGRHKP